MSAMLSTTNSVSHSLRVCLLSRFNRVQLFATLWTVALLSMGFSRQEYWSGSPCPPPGDLPDPGIELTFLKSLELAGRFFTTSTTWEAHHTVYYLPSWVWPWLKTRFSHLQALLEPELTLLTHTNQVYKRPWFQWPHRDTHPPSQTHTHQVDKRPWFQWPHTHTHTHTQS